MGCPCDIKYPRTEIGRDVESNKFGVFLKKRQSEKNPSL